MGLLSTVGVWVIGLALSGCSAADTKPAKKQPARQEAAPVVKSAVKPVAKPASPETDLTEEIEHAAEKPRDLGQPLVDDPGRLARLDQKEPVWIDRRSGQVVLLGEVCRAGYPLEFFATYSNRSYEAVVSVNVTPHIVHAGLLRVGAVAGHPARFQPKFVAPTGTEVAIEIRWKDRKGTVQSAPAQDWIRNIKTKKALDSNWVFAGSTFVTDETTGKEYYQADSGELICVLSLPTAMLDLPIRSYGALESRLFEAFEERLPPPGTPVTLLLKPIPAAKPAGKAAAGANGNRAEAEKKAIESAEPWLALVDQGQYTKSWETAAEYLKNSTDRRDFVRSLNATRKPLGDVKSRELQSKQYTRTLPGAPDGHYVVVQYKTTFANKRSAVETVTPMLDKDKKWRVSGYYIR